MGMRRRLVGRWSGSVVASATTDNGQRPSHGAAVRKVAGMRAVSVGGPAEQSPWCVMFDGRSHYVRRFPFEGLQFRGRRSVHSDTLCAPKKTRCRPVAGPAGRFDLCGCKFDSCDPRGIAWRRAIVGAGCVASERAAHAAEGERPW